MQPTVVRYGEASRVHHALLWRFPATRVALSSAVLGGGIGPCAWIVNAQVPRSYARTDPRRHVRAIARESGCRGRGVGMLTAATVVPPSCAVDGDTEAWATVGIDVLTRAADAAGAGTAWCPGTVNVVVTVPRRVASGALVNLATTATEAKVQAFVEAGLPATGTATDAVCIVSGRSGDIARFGGPRSDLGASVARAVHAAVVDGLRRCGA
jgi:adenosylcobinamide amidohydrolase